MDIALTVIKKTGNFQEALSKWFKLAQKNQTYVTLKTHFLKIRNILRKIFGPTMTVMGYGAANQLIQKVQSVREAIN